MEQAVKHFGYGLVALIFLGLGSGVAWGGESAQGAGQRARVLAQGKYLVTRAAPCADCHSPRGVKGQYMPGEDLQGAPIGFKPIHPVPGWADAAPSIAGLPVGWSFVQTVHFLETGTRPDGSQANPPMPPFRFNAHDARAIATYLQSLPHPGEGAH